MASKAFAAMVVLLVLAAGELAHAASSLPPVSTLPVPSSAPAQAAAAAASMEEASALATTRRHTRIAGDEGRRWGGEEEDGKSISVHSLPPEHVLPTPIPPTTSKY